MCRVMKCGSAAARRVVLGVAALGLMASACEGRPAPGTMFHELFATYGMMRVTSSQAFTPNLGFFGNMTAADWQVTSSAVDAGRRGVGGWNGSSIIYRAILSTSGNNAKDRLTISGPVYNTHGELLAVDEADLFDGNLLAAVNYDEYGALITSELDVWTGTTSSGVWSGSSCGAWNNPSNAVSGRLGDTTVTGPSWLSTGGVKVCNQNARLYGIGPLVTAPLWGDYDDDAVVDGDDFLVWQRSVGANANLPNYYNSLNSNYPGVSAGQLGAWQEYFGEALPEASAGVPEPEGVVLGIVAAIVVAGWRLPGGDTLRCALAGRDFRRKSATGRRFSPRIACVNS